LQIATLLGFLQQVVRNGLSPQVGRFAVAGVQLRFNLKRMDINPDGGRLDFQAFSLIMNWHDKCFSP